MCDTSTSKILFEPSLVVLFRLLSIRFVLNKGTPVHVISLVTLILVIDLLTGVTSYLGHFWLDYFLVPVVSC